MKISELVIGIVAAAGCSASMASTILTEGFEDFNSLAGKGWSLLNNSAPVGPIGWFQGNATVFAAASGPNNSYLAANYLSGAANAGGTIDDWALTPVLSLARSVKITFDLRLESGLGFIDTVQVYLSTSGSSTNLADFTLLTTYTSTADTGWQNKTVDLSSVNGITTGRVAFRYVAANTDTQADYIGIDTLLAVPEPGSLALAAFALAAAGGVRVQARRPRQSARCRA